MHKKAGDSQSCSRINGGAQVDFSRINGGGFTH